MYSEKGRYTIEVCFSPLFYPLYDKENIMVVVTDIFRASTAIVAAFDNGVKGIIPVKDIHESEAYKAKGFIVAGERDGKKLACADFGNSPFNFMDPSLRGQTIVLNTTNGTQAIETVSRGHHPLAIGAFTNLDAVAEYAASQQKNLVIYCAGWKNRFSLEDTLFAGALTQRLIQGYPGLFHTICDSAIAAADLWQLAQPDLMGYIQKAAHRHRLQKMGLDEVIPYCLSLNVTEVVPVLQNHELVKA